MFTGKQGAIPIACHSPVGSVGWELIWVVSGLSLQCSLGVCVLDGVGVGWGGEWASADARPGRVLGLPVPPTRCPLGAV